MSLRQKTISGVFWSFVDNGISQLFQFIVGIILARILSPKEFGLIGMITIFIAVADAFINSGFSQALIRKIECDQKDYSTAFYFNIVLSVFFYILIFISAPLISNFYNQPELTNILRVLGLLLFISAASIVQQAILIRAVNFRLMTKITFVSSLVSGVIAIAMALYGYGVWSLAVKMLLNNFLKTVLLWIFNSWKPLLIFSRSAFMEMYSFGYKLLASSLINTTYQNIYYLIIGKFFNVIELGYFTRADQFTKLPSQTLTKSLQRVAFPVLSEIQIDDQRLKNGYKRFIKVTMFLNATVMCMIAALSEPFILVLIGHKWVYTVPYLQLLCFAVLLYPLISLNLNILVVKGRSDLYLFLEILTKILVIPIIIIGIYTNIKIMIIGMIIHSFINFLIISKYTSRILDYRTFEQIKDILAGLIIPLITAAAIWMLQKYFYLSILNQLLLLTPMGLILITLISFWFKEDGFMEVKYILTPYVKKYLGYLK